MNELFKRFIKRSTSEEVPTNREAAQNLKGEIHLEDQGQEKARNHGDYDRPIHDTLNTIVGGEDPSFSCIRYTQQVLAVDGSPTSPKLNLRMKPKPNIVFYGKDIAEIHPNDNNPMVIIIRCDKWEIKRLLIDQGNSTDILY